VRLAPRQASFPPADADSGWGALRFRNDDEIAPNGGFPPHAHAKVEIITYVRDGAVTHRDSLGNTGRISAGDVQVMSAGTGIRHAEFNLEPQTTIGDSCRITLHQQADWLLYRRSTAL
jgi:redox-sensitive bicupin YhaK (pirin superfamily)